MGFGDELLAAGQAKLLHRKTGKKIAIGRPNKVYWSVFYEHNPYLVSVPKGNCIWLENYPGHRGYFSKKDANRYWWNLDYRAEPAEIFFGPDEPVTPGDYVVIECHNKAAASPGKRYPYWQRVVDLMPGIEFRQPVYGQPPLNGVKPIRTSLRSVAQLIAGARAYVGPDGCLHHLAAALGKPAVVVFGGFAPKEALGYSFHRNFGEGAMGYRNDCEYNREAMERIAPESLAEALREILDTTGDRLRSA